MILNHENSRVTEIKTEEEKAKTEIKNAVNYIINNILCDIEDEKKGYQDKI